MEKLSKTAQEFIDLQKKSVATLESLSKHIIELNMQVKEFNKLREVDSSISKILGNVDILESANSKLKQLNAEIPEFRELTTNSQEMIMGMDRIGTRYRILHDMLNMTSENLGKLNEQIKTKTEATELLIDQITVSINDQEKRVNLLLDKLEMLIINSNRLDSHFEKIMLLVEEKLKDSETAQ
jgi:hypothetical protein